MFEGDDVSEKDEIYTKRHHEKHEMDKWTKHKNHIMQMHHRDPLYIPADEIPENVEYYWVAESCMDKPDHARPMEMERRGWSAVPASRHPDMVLKRNFGKDDEHHGRDYIYYKGLVLYERDKELCEIERGQTQRMVDSVESNMTGVESGGPAHWRKVQFNGNRSGLRTIPRAFGF